VFSNFYRELSDHFNYCISHGVYPSHWKLSNVIPFFKKGCKTAPQNYRPISLLCCTSKIFERLVADKLNMKYILENNLISARQSGFMPNDSTCNQSIHITDDILQAFDKGQETIAIFMNISKAFDKVWHRGLLVKLQNNGIKGNLLAWLKSYLSDRSQCVVLNGTKSNPSIINEWSVACSCRCAVGAWLLFGVLFFVARGGGLALRVSIPHFK
jgi:hypothetical protein